MKTVWGFGGVRFVYGTIDVEFSGAHGDIIFKPIIETLINDEDSIVTRLHGYNVEIETSGIYNLTTDSYGDYIDFIDILSQLISSDSQNTVLVYPKYNSSYSNLSYSCILDSDVSLKDIARVEAGQVLNLKWKAVSKVESIPSLIHTDALTYWDGTDTYWDGADTYVDQD